jgi:hypothetical protein
LHAIVSKFGVDGLRYLWLSYAQQKYRDAIFFNIVHSLLVIKNSAKHKKAIIFNCSILNFSIWWKQRSLWFHYGILGNLAFSTIYYRRYSVRKIGYAMEIELFYLFFMGWFLFPSSHYNYNYKLQFFDFRCWWLSSSSPFICYLFE